MSHVPRAGKCLCAPSVLRTENRGQVSAMNGMDFSVMWPPLADWITEHVQAWPTEARESSESVET